MEELLNKLKELGAIRAIGDYADYEPEGKHKDTIYFAEDEEKIYLNGKNYGGKQEEIDISGLLEDYAKTSDLNDYVQKENGKVLSSNDYTDEDKAKVAIIDDKVDKVDGKQLSTNDYTDTDKAKVDNTYTKTEVDNRVENLGTILSEVWDAQLEDAFNNLDNKKADKTAIPTNVSQLTNDSKYQTQSQVDERFQQLIGAAPADLDTLEELAEKLQDGDDIHTALVQSISEKASKDEVVALCADTYAKKSETIYAFKAKDGDYIAFRLPTAFDPTYYSGNGFIECYTNNAWWNFKAGKFIVTGGTSSQFLKADGSVDGTAYYNANSFKNTQPTGGSAVSIPFKNIDNSTASTFGAMFADGEYQYSFIGWGTDTWRPDNNLSIGPEHFTYKGNKIFHEGNDGSGSGLDADLLDGLQGSGYLAARGFQKDNSDALDLVNGYYMNITGAGAGNSNYPSGYGHLMNFLNGNGQYGFRIYCDYNAASIKVHSTWDNNNYGWKTLAFTDSNVASADKLTTKQLTNEDLNTLILAEASFTIYHAISSNTCANKPSGVTNFSLHLIKVDSNPRTRQVLYADNSTYSRFWNGSSWTPWQQLATTDGAVAKLSYKVLTNENLDTLKDNEFSLYYGSNNNTCTNVPAGINSSLGFNLQVLRPYSGSDRVQILTSLYGQVYTRYFNGSVWSNWVKSATVNDAVAKLTTKTLTNENLNDIKDGGFRSYVADGNNTCSNKPTGVTGFNLTVYGYSGTGYCQIITSTSGDYKRKWTGSAWSAWKKMLTEDDIANLSTGPNISEPMTAQEYANLATKDPNTLYLIKEE